MSPRNPFILGSKGQNHESQKHWRRGSLHSCECWLLLVYLTLYQLRHHPSLPPCFSLFPSFYYTDFPLLRNGFGSHMCVCRQFTITVFHRHPGSAFTLWAFFKNNYKGCVVWLVASGVTATYCEKELPHLCTKNAPNIGRILVIKPDPGQLATIKTEIRWTLYRAQVYVNP